MLERTSKESTAGLSRVGFLGDLFLLAAALGLGFIDLGPMLRPGAEGSGTPARPRPQGRPSINPPLGSVKRRG